jgi:hypothetical protein
MAFDVFDKAKGRQMAERMARSDLMTDWGARPLSTTSKLFDPLHYNNGAVWGFVTGWVATAQFRYGNPHAGWQALRAIANTTFDEARGRNPEVISGRVYKPLDTAVPQQFFATSMILTPLLRGMLGLEVDAPAGLLTVAPWLPPGHEQVRVEKLAVGGVRLDLSVSERGPQAERVLLVAPSAGVTLPHPIKIRFAPPEGGVAEGVLAPGARSLRLALAAPRGWAAMLADAPSAVIGARSTNPRIVAARAEGGVYHVTLEALAGSTVSLWVQPPAGKSVVAEGEGVRVRNMSADFVVIDSPFKRFASHAAMTEIGMPASGEDADGYVRKEIVFRNR